MILFLIITQETASAINLSLISNAKFTSTDMLAELWNISSRDSCICQCYTIPNCIIANYNGLLQECQLFSSLLQTEQLHVVSIVENAAVMILNNRTQIRKEITAV